jgi:uncharacterized coiled-coil protein SlyX
MNAQTDLQNLLCFSPQLETDDAGIPRRFIGTCYSGGVIPAFGYFGDTAIDLSTLKAPRKALFALVNHDPDQRAGRCDISADGRQIQIKGSFMKTASGQSVAAEFAEGAPWEFSVGINAEPKVFNKPTEVEVNGQRLLLDTLMVNASVREVSFVPAGADPGTHAVAFAKAVKDLQMNEDNVLEMTRSELNAAHEEVTSLSAALVDERAAVELHKAELDAIKASLEAIQSESAAKQEEIERLTGLLKEAETEKRLESVKSLFSEIGREYTDEAARGYMALDDTAFALLASDLRFVASKRTDDSLFVEQATNGTPTDPNGTPTDPKSRLDLMAADLRKADPKLTYEMAVSRILRQNPSLYTEVQGA